MRTAPVAARSGGQFLLQYEMEITNASSKTMTIQRIEALGPESLLLLEGEALTRAFPEGFPAKAVVPGVQSTAVVFAFSVDRVPASLTHRIRFQMGDNPEPLTVEQPGTPVRLNTLRIHPPLSGANWLALNDLGATTITRAASCRARAESTCPSASPSTSYNSNHPAGHITAMQRTTANYHRYGAQALSVAEATVLEVRDGIPENVPDPEKRAVAMTLATVSGNHIVLDLGHGRFPPTPTFSRAPSAHKGDRVRVGQQLGLVGNSGNSAEPHLHSQITDGPEILGSDGLPYELVTFVHDGKRVRNELPRNRWVIDF